MILNRKTKPLSEHPYQDFIYYIIIKFLLFSDAIFWFNSVVPYYRYLKKEILFILLNKFGAENRKAPKVLKSLQSIFMKLFNLLQFSFLNYLPFVRFVSSFAMSFRRKIVLSITITVLCNPCVLKQYSFRRK